MLGSADYSNRLFGVDAKLLWDGVSICDYDRASMPGMRTDTSFFCGDDRTAFCGVAVQRDHFFVDIVNIRLDFFSLCVGEKAGVPIACCRDGLSGNHHVFRVALGLRNLAGHSLGGNDTDDFKDIVYKQLVLRNIGCYNMIARYRATYNEYIDEEGW